jgi:hypothetical protein
MDPSPSGHFLFLVYLSCKYFIVFVDALYVAAFLSSFFSFWRYWGLTQGLVFARQVLYRLAIPPAFFFAFIVFLDRVSCFCPG